MQTLAINLKTNTNMGLFPEQEHVTITYFQAFNAGKRYNHDAVKPIACFSSNMTFNSQKAFSFEGF